MNSNNPFAKNDTLNVGKDVAWDIDKKVVSATKSAFDGNATYYHLQFDNKQLKLLITSDANGIKPKKFNQLEVKDLKIDGKQNPLFKWCLSNQERHNRFLQQGLTVKNGVCDIDGNEGSFTMRLNNETLASLQEGSRLLIMLKPFRKPLELKYDISDFKDMYLALNAKPAPVAPVVAAPAKAKPDAKPKRVKKCWAGPPAEYKNIKSVEYDCADTSAKRDAETWVTKLVNKEKKKLKNQKKLAAEKEKKRKLAEKKNKKALAEKLKREKALQAETAAIAASKAKQAQLGDEITQKMVNVCKKYWDKGEHRCYCQKYIKHAPSSIQASSTCE